LVISGDIYPVVDRSPIIEMRNVTVSKGKAQILHQVDLRIDSGERLVIIGPNGSGKSSLIKLMTGEWWSDTSVAGSQVKILGSERWDLFDVRRAFGLVSSELQQEFRKEVDVLETVISGAFGSIGINRSHSVGEDLKSRAQDALRSVGSSHLAIRNMASLSTGEARRVLMARALMNDPMALILDEPMTSLDLIGKSLVMEGMRKLAKGGRALILVTHDPSDIPPEVERVVMMKQGRIFMDSGIASMNDENLSALFDVPVRLRNVDGRFLAWS
jgi:iron complex transport system ATP-binding protein